MAVFKTIKQLWYESSLQIIEEWKSTESFALKIKWNNKEIVSDSSVWTNKKDDFIRIIIQLPSSDLISIQSNILNIERQIGKQIIEEEKNKVDEINLSNIRLKDIILSKIDQKDFWNSDNYSEQRFKLSSLLNKKNTNDEPIINNQELIRIKQSIIWFVGSNNIANINTLEIWSDNREITVEGKYLKNKSISNAIKKEIKEINESNAHLDINKIWVTINSKILTNKDNKKWNELNKALKRILWKNSYRIDISKNEWFRNFLLDIKWKSNIYLSNQNIYDRKFSLNDNTKNIEIKWNQIIMTNFDWTKNTLEVK